MILDIILFVLFFILGWGLGREAGFGAGMNKADSLWKRDVKDIFDQYGIKHQIK